MGVAFSGKSAQIPNISMSSYAYYTLFIARDKLFFAFLSSPRPHPLRHRTSNSTLFFVAKSLNNFNASSFSVHQNKLE